MQFEHYHTFLNHRATKAFMDRWRPRCKSILIARYGSPCEPDEEEEDAAVIGDPR